VLNSLFYGDNLDVLRQHIDTETVDLVYLDPPFNSNRSYNVLFKSHSGQESQAQIEAFGDSWTWSQQAEKQYQALVAGGAPIAVSDAIEAMRTLLGTNDVLAYLVMMTARLVELHRVLKSSGSLYLHCDPTASHYLKVMLDAIFGLDRFQAEIVWKRTTAHSDGAQGGRQVGRVHDVVLAYVKGNDWTWNPQFTSHAAAYVESKYRYIEDGTRRRYRLDNITGPGGAAKGNPSYEVMGVTRYWRYSRPRMAALIAEGRIVQTRPGTVPQFKRYLDETEGLPLQDVWSDISPINSQAAERLGYPTQKPMALLERIIALSSNPGDVVLDPFCGCGTAVDAAQKLGRNWIGIDVTYLAIDLITKRLRNTYGDDIQQTYRVHGIPTDLAGAKALFDANPFDFERWAVSLVNGQPNEKQVGDKGIDGRIRFHASKDRIGTCIVSVKGGAMVNPSMVRDLVGTLRKAEMGLLIVMAPITRGMREVADNSGSYVNELTGTSYSKVQIVTVENLLAQRFPAMPSAILPYVKARPYQGEQLTLKAGPTESSAA
jgi:DNA modification methylase